jgi:hypothetical protein
MGFTFDDTDKKGVATSLSEMRRLITIDPHNQEVIYPFIGGEEVSSSPTHLHNRFVINFGERDEEECRMLWPSLMQIVESKVKPERLIAAQKSKSAHGKRASIWWQHYHHAKDLYSAIAHHDRVLVNPLYGTHLSFAFLATGQVFANKLNVMPFDSYSAFALLQSRVHEVWARMFSSTLKDDLAYAPSDCFETFPFPTSWQSDSGLELFGATYYQFRAALMARNDEGLTKTYNRFHDPDERTVAAIELRNRHAEMDRVVLDAYEWHDIPTACEFVLDFEVEEDEPDSKKRPWRYRWPDEVRDEVLARLLELNAERAREERRTGASTASVHKPKAALAGVGDMSDIGDLFS